MKKKKENPTEEYLRRIAEALEKQSSYPIFPPMIIPNVQVTPNVQCPVCGAINCGKMHVTC